MEIGIIWHEFGGGLVERLTRREFLKLVGAGTAWVMLGGCVQPPSVTPSPTTPQPQVTKELKIGVISYRTGPLAMFGEPFHHASDYIADSLNAAGGVGGFKIKILHEDQGSTASETVEKAKKLILEDKVDVITGIPATGHSLGVAPVCDSNNVLYLQVQARPEYGTWRDIDNPSKGIFDWVFQLGNSTTSHALQYVYIVKDLYPEVKTIAQIHPDYAYGYDIYNIFTSALKKLKPGLEFFDPLYPKLFTPDYTPYINELVKMKPDLIYVGLWGTDFTRFVDQLLPYGLLKGAGGKTILAGFWDYYPSIGREIPVYGHPQASNQGLFDYPGYKEVIKTIVWHYKTYGWFQTGGVGCASPRIQRQDP